MVAFLLSQPFVPPERRHKDALSQRFCVNSVALLRPPARNSSLIRQRIQLALGAAAALAAISLSPGSAQAYGCTPRVEQDV